MKSVIFVVDTKNIRTMHPKQFWLANALKDYAPGWAGEVMLSGSDRPELDSAAVLDQGERVAVVHYLGPYGPERVAFCLNDLTERNEFVVAARMFGQQNGGILHELITL